MKALTIKQPWASLIIEGYGGLLKDIENRTWPTGVRGRIAIHASAKLDKREMDSAAAMVALIKEGERASFEVLSAAAREFDAEMVLPLGAVLGTVEIVDCVRKSDSPWFFGPWGFVLRNLERFAVPIPARGALSFWEWTP